QAVAEALHEMEEQTGAGMARPRPKTRKVQRGGISKTEAARAQLSLFGRKRPPTRWLIGMAGGLVAAVLAGIVLFWPTPRGVVTIESDDPSVEIVFDKTGPTIRGAGKEPIALGAGEHGVLIKRGEFEFEAARFVLKKGATTTLKVELLSGKIQVKADGRVIGARDLPAVSPVGANPVQGDDRVLGAGDLPAVTAAGVRPGGPLPKTFTNRLGMEFVLVPKGTFLMGGGGGRPGNK